MSQTMNTYVSLARRRLSILRLAEKLGNVSEACRQRGVTRTQFYEYKKRFETFGLEGLADRPPVHRSHPQTTPGVVETAILELAVAHPGRGCNYLESLLLGLEGPRVSAITIQKILNRHGLGTRRDRWLALERQYADIGVEPSPEQAAFIDQHNPAFRERQAQVSRPGKLLAQDILLVGRLKGQGEIYLHVVVDTFNGFAFGLLSRTQTVETAARLVLIKVFPFYVKDGLMVQQLVTSQRVEYGSLVQPAYISWLARIGIGHLVQSGPAGQTNGFIQRCRQTAQAEFFENRLGQRHPTTLEALQADLDLWLHHYNYEQPFLGYPNQGQTPAQRLDRYVCHRPANESTAGGQAALLPTQ